MKKKKFEKKNIPVATTNTDIPKNTKTTIRRLLTYLMRQKLKIFLVLGLALFSSISFTLMPIFVGQGIDALVIAIQDHSSTPYFLQAIKEALFLPVLALIILGLLASLLSYSQQYIIASVGEELTLSLRKEISDKITKLPLSFFDTHKTGDVLSRATNDLEKVSEVIQVGLMQFIASAFTIIVTFIAMLILNPLLTLIVFISVICSSIATKIVSEKCQKSFAANQKVVGAINSQIEELYSGNLVLKVFNQQERVIDTVIDLNEKQYKTMKKAQFITYAIYPTIRLLNQLGFIATALFGGFMAIQGHLSLGTVQAFLQYVNQIGEPISESSYVINSLQAALAGSERVFELLDESEEIPDCSTEKALTAPKGTINFEHVQFGYTPEKLLMQDLNFEIKPNETVAIVGPTGGGKTTLINLLMRFYELNGGKITIDNVDIKDLSRASLRRLIGMVLQDTWLFHGTVADNIAYGKMDATREEIINVAKAARCDHFIRTLPQGYDTLISSEEGSVSQGQMQLLTIARAMLANPSIMILDEATSSVDTRTEVEIQKAMNKIMEGKTSFVIAHRLSTIVNADLILVVKDGDIIEKGNHQALLRAHGFYADLYQSQFA